MKGSSAIAFILVLPWVIFIFLAITTLTLSSLMGNFLHYGAFQESRAKGIYLLNQSTSKINLPVSLALQGESVDLSSQTAKDRFGYPSFDNWIPFCGVDGRYTLCPP